MGKGFVVYKSILRTAIVNYIDGLDAHNIAVHLQNILNKFVVIARVKQSNPLTLKF